MKKTFETKAGIAAASLLLAIGLTACNRDETQADPLPAEEVLQTCVRPLGRVMLSMAEQDALLHGEVPPGVVNFAEEMRLRDLRPDATLVVADLTTYSEASDSDTPAYRRLAGVDSQMQHALGIESADDDQLDVAGDALLDPGAVAYFIGKITPCGQLGSESQTQNV